MNSSGTIIDKLNAREDIKNKIIKTVGDPTKKFNEDPTRLLRALRFSTLLGFELDKDIEEYILNNKEDFKKINGVKKKYELDKVLLSSEVFDFVAKIRKYDLESVLGIKFKKLIKTNNLVGMWAQIDFDDSIPLTKIEREQISSIRALLEKESIDKDDIYKYGSFISVTAGSILGLNVKKINKIYEKFPIKEKTEIAIDADTICDILNISPSKQLGEVYTLLEREILDYKLVNKKDNIIKRLNKLKGDIYE